MSKMFENVGQAARGIPLMIVWVVGFIPGLIISAIVDMVAGIFRKRKVGETEDGTYSTEIAMAEGNFYILVSGAVITALGAIWGVIKIF